MSNFEEAYELTGHGKFNLLALLTCGFVLLHVTTECLGVGYLLNQAECDLQISVAEKGFIAGATFYGVVSTAILWGYLGDACGRRAVMLPAILCTMMFSFISSLAINFWHMFIFRVLTGCLISASAATVYAFLGELQTTSRRAMSVAWASAFIAGAFVTMPGMAWIILPQKWSYHIVGNLTMVPWRVFMWAWCLWGSLAVAGLLVLPESPRFLLAVKGPGVVIPILAQMYAWNHNKKKTDYPVKEITSTVAPTRPKFKESILKLKHMFRTPLLRCVIISHLCIGLLFFQSNAFYVWMPHIVNKLLNSNTTAVSMCDIMDREGHKDFEPHKSEHCKATPIDSRMYPISMVMGALVAAIYLSIGVVIEKWGRKLVYAGIVVTCSMFTLTSGLVPHAHAAIALLIPGLCGGAATSVLATITIEVFPTSFRAMALCTLFMVARLGAAVGSQLLGVGLHNNCVLATVGFTMVTAGSTLLVMLWPDGAKVRAEMEAKGFTY